MGKHNGQIVEYVIRRKGISITEIASALGVNRRSVYNYFNNRNLNTTCIKEIGLIIKHDFSLEFPEHFSTEDFVLNELNSNVRLKDEVGSDYQKKYIWLLEKYNDLLSR